jgi:hypothetical protein
MAFQQNYTALATADLEHMRILPLAKHLDLMLTIKSSLANWECKLARNWFNFANLTIITWYNAHGAIINGTTTVYDTSIFLSIQNGAANQCLAEGLKHVHI